MHLKTPLGLFGQPKQLIHLGTQVRFQLEQALVADRLALGGFRLCTEAEWEKACRGEAGSIYPWSATFDTSLANIHESGVGNTTEVGSYSPERDGPYGVADMSGNALEWVADWYDGSYCDYAPLENPPGPESGDGRVFRGGSFWGHAADARCAWRGGAEPDRIGGNFGFHVCMSPP